MTWLQRLGCPTNWQPRAVKIYLPLAHRWAIWLPLAVIRLYQLLLSPILGANCRFAPSCSEYARLALVRHGLWRGSLLALQRLARCHPWHPGGWDPVP